MKSFRQLLLPFPAFIILCCTALPNVPGNMMPYISGKDLNGTPWSVPKGLPGVRTLVLIGFEEQQQATIDTWTRGLGLDQPANKIPWVEIPLIENPGMFMRWFIDTGMRGGIKGREPRAHVWTAYTDKKAFLASCGIPSDKEVRVLVVERTGRILQSECGAYSKEGADRLLKALSEYCESLLKQQG